MEPHYCILQGEVVEYHKDGVLFKTLIEKDQTEDINDSKRVDSNIED